MCDHDSLTPAERVIAKFGTVKSAAQALGIQRQNVERWRKPRSKGGCDGIVPAHHQIEILRHAVANGLNISPEDFLPADLADALRRSANGGTS